MFRAIARTVLLITSCVLLAQSTKELPSFEVASVKRRSPPPGPNLYVAMDDHGPGSVIYRNVDLKSLLMTAYHLEDYQIKAPGWIDSERYDISARVLANASYSQRRLMLRRLLAERLQLRAHLEKRELPAYSLKVGKNPPTLRKAKVQTVAEDGSMAASLSGGGRLDAKGQSMHGLAEMLSNELRGPVLDETGIKGEYDLVLTWGLDAGLGTAAEETTAESVAIALQRETGLVLTKQKALVAFLVVDHVEKVPTEN